MNFQNSFRTEVLTVAAAFAYFNFGTIGVAETLVPSAGVQWGLIVSPMLAGAIALVVAFITIRFDARKSINQELIKKRISIYDSVVPKLNDLLCFFLCRGSWKTLSPPLLIQKKRELDQTMYVYGPLFSDEVFIQYNSFIHLCFKMFMGAGRDACLRADLIYLKSQWKENWLLEWDSYFVAPEEVAKTQDVFDAYNFLLAKFASEIGAKRQTNN